MLNDEKLLARGLARLNEIDGEAGEAVMKALADVAPDLGQYIIAFALGEIYTRPQLDLQQRARHAGRAGGTGRLREAAARSHSCRTERRSQP